MSCDSHLQISSANRMNPHKQLSNQIVISSSRMQIWSEANSGLYVELSRPSDHHPLKYWTFHKSVAYASCTSFGFREPRWNCTTWLHNFSSAPLVVVPVVFSLLIRRSASPFLLSSGSIKSIPTYCSCIFAISIAKMITADGWSVPDFNLPNRQHPLETFQRRNHQFHTKNRIH